MDLGLFAFKKSTSCESHYWQKVEGRRVRRRERVVGGGWGAINLFPSFTIFAAVAAVRHWGFMFFLFLLWVIICSQVPQWRYDQSPGTEMEGADGKMGYGTAVEEQDKLQITLGRKTEIQKRETQAVDTWIYICMLYVSTQFFLFFICCFNHCFVFLIL